jgi:hypothetical protein
MSAESRTPLTIQLLSALETKAAQLNESVDELNAGFDSVQKRLIASGIGLECWVSMEHTRMWTEDTYLTGYRIWDEHQLGYGRHANSWALLTRPAHFEESHEGEKWTYQAAKPLVRSPRDVRVAAVRALPALLSALQTEAERVLAAVAEAKQLAQSKKLPACYWCRVEQTSARRLDTGGPRECPACNHVFQGNGWDGIDAHWRAEHARPLGIPYDDFWRGIMGCARHWGGAGPRIVAKSVTTEG